MPKINKKVRVFDEGLDVIKEITKTITHDDGTVETKVEKIKIGQRSHHSDYWREHYNVADKKPEGISKEKYLMSKCLHEVARVANAFDDSIELGYKNLQNPANNPQKNQVLLDPGTALSEDELGAKVDVFSGEILLGTALRKQSYETKQDYVFHLNRAFDQSADEVDRAASYLYLAMEADAACEYVKEHTPGFTGYAHSRAKKYVSEEGSAFLQEEFDNGTTDGGHRFAALIREFDTFATDPLDYGPFGKVIENIMSQVRSLPDAKTRLQAAEQLAYRYLIEQNGQVQMPNSAGGENSGLNGEFEMSGQAQGESGNSQDGNQSGSLDMDLMEEMLSSASMLGKPGESGELFATEGAGLGQDKPKSVSELLKDQMFEGVVDPPEVKLVTTIPYYNSQRAYAESLYQKNKDEVYPISQAIEESLEILNHDEKTWDEYALRRGELDEGALHKLVDNSDNVFYLTETLPKMRVQISLLIDESGSMCCYQANEDGSGSKVDHALTAAHGDDTYYLNRIGVARKLAVAFQEGTKDIEGADLSVYGHAGPSPCCHVYKYTDADTPEDSFSRLSMITDRLHNYDGFAILKTGEDMLQSHESYDRRIMFIISDGEPSVANYNGEESQKHIRSVIRHLNDQGIETYVIGIDNAFPPSIADKMYGSDNYIILPDFDLSKVAVIMSSFLEEVCKEQR